MVTGCGVGSIGSTCHSPDHTCCCCYSYFYYYSLRHLIVHSLALRERGVAQLTTAAAAVVFDAAAVAALLLHHPRDPALEGDAAAHRLDEELEALAREDGCSARALAHLIAIGVGIEVGVGVRVGVRVAVRVGVSLRRSISRSRVSAPRRRCAARRDTRWRSLVEPGEARLGAGEARLGAGEARLGAWEAGLGLGQGSEL